VNNNTDFQTDALAFGRIICYKKGGAEAPALLAVECGANLSKPPKGRGLAPQNGPEKGLFRGKAHVRGANDQIGPEVSAAVRRMAL
jgi:hypothetical protein